MAIISARPVAVNEGAGFVDVEVRLDAAAATEVRVSWWTENSSASYGADYTYGRDQLVFAPGQTSKTIRIAIADDKLVEGNETFWLKLYEPVNAAIGQTYTSVWIADNDGAPGTPLLAVSDAMVDETDGTASFLVRASRPSATPFTVSYATMDGSATAGADYVAASGMISFAAGETVKTVSVALVDDKLPEGDESFGLQLSNASGATLVDASGQAVIAHNDTDPVGMPYVTITAAAASEGSTYLSFSVQLSAPSVNEVRVNWQTDNATAAYNQDFDYMREQLVFAPGQTQKVVQVPLIDDTQAEPTEVFWLQLYDASNAVIERTYTAALVVDNDGRTGTPALAVGDVVVDETEQAARFFVTLDRPSVSPVTVHYRTADDTAQAGQDFVATAGSVSFMPGETVQSVLVPLLDDGAAEADEFLQLVLETPSGATLGDGTALALLGRSDGNAASSPYVVVQPVAVGEGQTFIDVVVQLSAPSPNEVKLSYQTDNATAAYNADFQYQREQLVFAPGETTKQVRIPMLDDTVAEPEQVLWFNLYNPVNAIVPTQLTPIRIVDNDGTAGTPALSVSDAVVDETTQRASFFVQLDRPSATSVSVAYATADGSAAAGADYRAASGTLNFAPGEVVKTVLVDIVDDGLTENLETFALKLSGPVNATLGDASGVGFIGRSDGPTVAQPQISATPASAGEGDTFATVIVQLSAPSSNEVKVSWQTDNASAKYNSDFQYERQSLTFAPGETVKAVQVVLLDDTAPESPETFDFTLYKPVNASLSQSSTAVTIIDDDSGGRVFSYGLGDDQYTVGGLLDQVVESPQGGIDTVRAGFGYALPENVENLVLTGTAPSGVGNAGNNVFRGNAANNTFDGQAGIDTVVFAGPEAAYAVAGNLATRTVASSAEGSDTLHAIERLQFADVVRASDTTPGGHVYQAYAMFNAGFNRAPDVAELSLWTSQLDRLGSTRDLAQVMINTYAPGVPDEVLVAHLWGTIIGGNIPLDALRQYTGLVGNGTFTQASLVDYVAALDLNTNEIVGIVGQALPLDPAYFPFGT